MQSGGLHMGGFCILVDLTGGRSVHKGAAPYSHFIYQILFPKSGCLHRQKINSIYFLPPHQLRDFPDCVVFQLFHSRSREKRNKIWKLLLHFCWCFAQIHFFTCQYSSKLLLKLTAQLGRLYLVYLHFMRGRNQMSALITY